MDGAALDELRRPALLITNSLNWDIAPTMPSLPMLRRGNEREKQNQPIINLILETVRAGGNVLLPVDTAGRVLELMLMLDQQWETMKGRLGQYKLVLLHHMAHNVVEFVRSMVEWMSHERQNAFDARRQHPCVAKRRASVAREPRALRGVVAHTRRIEDARARRARARACRALVALSAPPPAPSLPRSDERKGRTTERPRPRSRVKSDCTTSRPP